MTAKPHRPVVLACGIMKPEIEALRNGTDAAEVQYLDQGLHRTPERMPSVLQEHIDRAAPYASRIVLGFGLCSNGVVGVTARRQSLIVPRAHDCIALFLGSLAEYRRRFSAQPGTYYLTPGWIAEKKDPLGIVEHDYAPRYGRDRACWAMREELKNYTHIVLIRTGACDPAPLRQRAMENAAFFGKRYEEIPGSLEYFTKILRGPYTGEDFFVFEPGREVSRELFLL